MSGIDIVLHQVMPGMGEYQTAAALLGGMVDSEFFHYMLAQMAASQARQVPHMKGRAVCEVFGAFGWAEGAPFMNWLMDFLLVRGVNHFVPHAFTDFFPDPDWSATLWRRWKRSAVSGLYKADGVYESGIASFIWR